MKQKRLLHCTLMVILFVTANISFGQKVTTEEFLEEHENSESLISSFDSLLLNLEPEENKINKKIKSELDKNLPLILVKDEKSFPAPCNLHKFDLDAGKFSLEFISLGDMMGFKKTIMFPIIKVYNKEGELVDGVKVLSYGTRSPTGSLPFHVYTLWEFNIEAKGEYYIQVASDNSSADGVRLHVSNGYAIATGAGLAAKNLLKGYPVKRSPYGKYKMTLK